MVPVRSRFMPAILLTSAASPTADDGSPSRSAAPAPGELAVSPGPARDEETVPAERPQFVRGGVGRFVGGEEPGSGAVGRPSVELSAPLGSMDLSAALVEPGQIIR